MTIDDLIEKLNELRSRNGNIEVVLDSQEGGDLVYRDPVFEYATVWGDAKRHRNFVKYGGSLRIKNPDDDPQEVVIIHI